MAHGQTLTEYTRGCRCDDCRAAMRNYQRARRSGGTWADPDHEAMRDLLVELCPDGLTDDCPVRTAARGRHLIVHRP